MSALSVLLIPAKRQVGNNITQEEKPKLKTVDEIAKEVIQGKWSAGDERKLKLTAAGYDYSKVQARVNELMKNQ